MNKKWIPAGFFVLLCATLVFFLTAKKPEPAVPKNNAPETGKNAGTYIYNGNISSKNIQNCVSTMALQLVKLYVKDGDYVKKGDLLYLLDDSDIAANISQALAGIQFAQVNLERSQLAAETTSQIAAQSAFDAAAAAYNEAKNNMDRLAALQPLGGISQTDVERAQIAVVTAEGQYNQAKSNYETMGEQSSLNVRAAQAQLAQARAIYEAAKVSESKRRVTAEIDGMVADIWVHESNMLPAGQKIMDIIDTDKLMLEIEVDQFEISAFETGKSVPVYVHALNVTVNGMVSKISNQAIKTGEVSCFIVTIELEKNPALKIGLLAEVKINV